MHGLIIKIKPWQTNLISPWRHHWPSSAVGQTVVQIGSPFVGLSKHFNLTGNALNSLTAWYPPQCFAICSFGVKGISISALLAICSASDLELYILTVWKHAYYLLVSYREVFLNYSLQVYMIPNRSRMWFEDVRNSC